MITLPNEMILKSSRITLSICAESLCPETAGLVDTFGSSQAQPETFVSLFVCISTLETSAESQ